MENEAYPIRNLGEVTLIYADEYGGLYEQPLGDITEVGTLIDPVTGEDLELFGWRLS